MCVHVCICVYVLCVYVLYVCACVCMYVVYLCVFCVCMCVYACAFCMCMCVLCVYVCMCFVCVWEAHPSKSCAHVCACCSDQNMLTQTLDSLLDLQSTLLAKIPGVTGGGGGQCHPPQPSSEDVEEIPSDSEAGDCPDVVPEVSDCAKATKQQRKRKRTREWVRTSLESSCVM